MQSRNVPATGPRYWTAISIASVFGANLGDFFSHNLHMGHIRGVPPLALAFCVILLLERRSTPRTEAYYWLAIVTLRTMATNLADLATHDLKLGYGWVIAGLAALLLAVLSPGRTAPAASGLPPTDGRYWAAMLVAGTLGTALGDAMADDIGLGVGLASAVFGVVLAALFSIRTRPAFITKASYWATIVAVRTTGTNVGDLVAHTVGLGPSTAATGLLLAGTLLLWKEQPGAALLRQA